MSGAVKNEIMQSKELAEELHKPITGKFEAKSTFIFYIMYKYNLGCWSSKYGIIKQMS